MKTAIIYVTKTGHSRKIAKAISSKLGVPALDIASSPELSNVDLLFLVSGVYGGQSAPELIEYVKSIDSTKAKNVVFVTSCASGNDKPVEVQKLLESNGVNVLEDEFLCKGGFLFISAFRPNKADIINAAEFAQNTYDLQITN